MINTIFISILSIAYFQPYPDNVEGKVVKVIDGNTIEVLTKEDETIKVMLKEVDCPELSQDYGQQAKDFTEKLIYKKKVVVLMKGKDRWGNKLAVVKLKNDKILHEELLKNGLAWVREKEQELTQIEARAKENKTGLWNNEAPTPPWVYRRKQTMLRPKSLN